VTGAALNDLKPAMMARQAQEVDPKAVEAVEAALYMLRAVVLLSRATIVDKDREAPEVLLDVAVALHDIVFDLPSCRASDAIFQSAMELQGAVVELCEIWWLDNREGGAELVPQAISYMGVRVLHELASTADVKRLYTFRSALQVLDYADESVRPLKRLLLPKR
jgi:condensin-2 complex subunit G2